MKSDIPRGPTIAHRAAEWLATLTDASCTNDERQDFVEWLKSSNLHVDEFLRVSALTRRLARSGAWPRKDIEVLIAEATAAPERVSGMPQRSERSKVDAARGRTQRRGALSRPAWIFATCGVVAIVVVAAFLLKLDPVDFTGETYSTSIGELRSLTLEDGSVVELNTHSRLRAHFTEEHRDVWLLRGEAVFKVAKNPRRPFRVSTGSTEIVAVGTEFNVYARATQTVVTVLEGRVRVTDRPRAARAAPNAAVERKLELTVGEQAVIAPHLPIERVKLADSRQVTSWTERRLIFEDTPLAAAADEFARYNTRSIRIENPELRNLRVSGVFNATDPASLVQFVEAYGNVSTRENAAGWTLDVP